MYVQKYIVVTCRRKLQGFGITFIGYRPTEVSVFPIVKVVGAPGLRHRHFLDSTPRGPVIDVFSASVVTTVGPTDSTPRGRAIDVFSAAVVAAASPTSSTPLGARHRHFATKC
jgi:hypothetical protein